MNSWITPALPKDVDIEFQSKYILTYRTLLVMFCSFLVVDLMLYFIFTFPSFIIFLFLSIITFFCVYFVKTSLKYKKIVLFFNIVLAIACQLNLYLCIDQIHFFDPLLIVINILFAFLVLDYKISFSILIIHSLMIGYFFVNFGSFTSNSHVDDFETQVFYSSFLFMLFFLVIGIIGWQNNLINTRTSIHVLETQRALESQVVLSNQQNEEKTVMLKEIHHRVKNNLQIITSLLRLQSRELENPEAISKFKDSTNRVIAMSMIHEKMYQTDELSTMNLREYLHDLSHDLVISYQSDYEVKIDIECEIDAIGLKSVVPLALILNELISNTLKYAFDDYDKCSISISFTSYIGDQCKMVYSDSGTWKAPSRKGSFGMDLIESLTMQLEGTMQLETFPKTQFEFLFAPLGD